MKRIVLTGPESSGKTTLAKYLAETFDTVWVPEYARTYLEHRDGKYTAGDLVTIAEGQCALLLSASEHLSADTPVFMDTWMLELEIWANVRFGAVPEAVARISNTYPPDLYLLCKPDIPWEADPLRENPDDRDKLFVLYENAVVKSGVPVILVTGTGPSRLSAAADATREFLRIP